MIPHEGRGKDRGGGGGRGRLPAGELPYSSDGGFYSGFGSAETKTDKPHSTPFPSMFASEFWDSSVPGGIGAEGGGGGAAAGGSSSSNNTLSPLEPLCDEDRDPYCMFANFTFEVNSSEFMNFSVRTGSGSPVEPKYWTILLVMFPMFTVFGNVLVVLSVVREKSLKTVTNYFICSLAVADIMVAVVVMPFAVYVEVVGGWWLSDLLCDAWVAADVMACTASILNLTAISVDRFIAVTQPIKYAKHRNSKRVYIMIAITWVISVAIAMPISLGVNYTPGRREGDCAFYNADFIIYSSMGSFYIPSLIMIFLYWKIYRVIRLRALKAQAAAAARKKIVDARAMQNVIENAGATGGEDGGRGGGGGGMVANNSSLATGSETTGLATMDNGRVTSYNTTASTTTIANAAATTSSTSSSASPQSVNKPHHHHHHHYYHHYHHQQQQQQRYLTPPILEETSISNMASGSEDEDYEDEDEDEDMDESEDYESQANTYSLQQDSEDGTQMQTSRRFRSEDGTLDTELIVNPGAEAAERREKRGKIKTSKGSYSDPIGSRLDSVGARLGSHEAETPFTSPIIGRGSGRGRGRGSERGKRGKSKNNCSGDGSASSTSRKKKGVSKFNFHMRTSRKRKEKSSSRKEKKATKTLAIVLGGFLLCWVPFFTINIFNAICIRYELQDYPACNPDKMLFSFFVWLGYINSFLNPVIYTIFNPEFRKAFKKILTEPRCCNGCR